MDKTYTLHQIAVAINAAQTRWHVGHRAVMNIIDHACGFPMYSKVPWSMIEPALRQHWLFHWIRGEDGLKEIQAYLRERWGDDDES